jgi:hypothetical protein
VNSADGAHSDKSPIAPERINRAFADTRLLAFVLSLFQLFQAGCMMLRRGDDNKILRARMPTTTVRGTINDVATT